MLCMLGIPCVDAASSESQRGMSSEFLVSLSLTHSRVLTALWAGRLEQYQARTKCNNIGSTRSVE
jgi:hypothetical protein